MTSRIGFSGVALRGVAALGLVVLTAGCDGIFDVTNPGSLTVEDLSNPVLLPALQNVPEAAGGEELASVIMTSGLVGNDVMQPSTLTPLLFLDWGRVQNLPNSTSEGLYDGLAIASWHAREATNRIKALVAAPDADLSVGKGYFYDAYLMIVRADLFAQITFDGGPPMTPVQVYGDALTLMAKAVQVVNAAGSAAANIQYRAAGLGLMARAERALFFETKDASHLAKAEDYAKQAMAIQATFRLDARYANSPGQTNGVFGNLGVGRSLSNYGIGVTFANWIDPVTGQKDPRVGVVGPVGSGSFGPFYNQSKYGTATTSLPVVRWQEASLIIAENRLQVGDLAGAVTEINRVRTAASRPAFASVDAARIKQQLIFERQTEFWLEGFSWQDMRNYGIVPLEWTPESIAAGLSRRIPVSERERNANTNF